MGSIIVTGVDLEEIDRLRRIPEPIRTRFIDRILTQDEAKKSFLSEEHIIGLFCAKEAVAKALGCGIGVLSWQDIEILAQGSGLPQVHLTGNAERIANELGITHWSLSISHTRAYAVAFVVGTNLT
jgi:holo-[acyl-carrier protein] synthase